MSTANIEQQADLFRSQIDNLFWEGAFDDWATNEPERLQAEIALLGGELHDPQNSKTNEEPHAPAPVKKTIKERREELKAMSQEVKPLVGEFGEYETVNEAIIDIFYKPLGHTELKTFDDWLKVGKVVKKGQTALIVWGSPIKRKQKEGEEVKPLSPDAQADENEKDYFPVCFLFSQLQVAPVNTKNHERN
jgi:hypothetical protein